MGISGAMNGGSNCSQPIEVFLRLGRCQNFKAEPVLGRIPNIIPLRRKDCSMYVESLAKLIKLYQLLTDTTCLPNRDDFRSQK
jgi:hypothetical protein